MGEVMMLETVEHRRLAVTLHGMVWTLLEKGDRDRAEDEAMVYQAYASCFHWLHAGTEVNHQRGEWLISRVCVELGRREPALVHAQRCLELTEEHKNEMEDYDIAFAYQAMADALALKGDQDQSKNYRQMAERAGMQIADEKDREVFFTTLRGN